MKIDNRIKSIILLFLLVSTNIITCYSKANKFASYSKSKRVSKNSSKSNYQNGKIDDIEMTDFSSQTPEEEFANSNHDSKYVSEDNFKPDIIIGDKIKYLYFFLGMIECLPHMKPFVKLIEKILNDAKYCRVSEMIDAYHTGIQESHNLPQTTFNNVNSMMEDMPWVPMLNGEKIELDVNNVIESCKKLLKARNEMIKENIKYVDEFYSGFTSALDIKKSFGTRDEITALKFIDEANNIIIGRNSGYRNLKRFLMSHFYHNLQNDEQLTRSIGNNWKNVIIEVIGILRENGKQALQNVQSLQISQEENINCKNLNMQKMGEEYENAKPTFLEKLSGGWNAIVYLKDCFVKGAKQDQSSKVVLILKIILKIGINKLIEVFLTKLAILIGFWFVKGIKIAFWGFRIVSNISKAMKERKKVPVNKKIEFKYWGIATGSAIRMLYTIIAPIGKK